jgi:hypothetical protein
MWWNLDLWFLLFYYLLSKFFFFFFLPLFAFFLSVLLSFLLLSNWFLFLSSFVFSLLFWYCFIPVSLIYVVSSLTYPNLLETKRLDCCCCCCLKSKLNMSKWKLILEFCYHSANIAPCCSNFLLVCLHLLLFIANQRRARWRFSIHGAEIATIITTKCKPQNNKDCNSLACADQLHVLQPNKHKQLDANYTWQ